MITVVSYHVEVPQIPETIELTRRRDQWGGRDYDKLLGMLGDSIDWINPDWRRVVVTDLDTKFADRTADRWERFRRRRVDYRVGAHRMEAYAAFLENQPRGEYVFCDTDVLFNKDPSPLFDAGDICLTGPDPSRPRLNSGIVYVSNRDAGIEWFLDAAETVHTLDPEQQQWMGDQWAQQIMCFGEELIRDGDDVFYGQKHIHIHPCEIANWSPARSDKSAYEGVESIPEQAYLLHFKGPRKKIMEQYYNYMREQRNA